VGLQPTDLIRGHPRLRAPETKTWIRGTSPRKTAGNRFPRAVYRFSSPSQFPRTALRGKREPGLRTPAFPTGHARGLKAHGATVRR